MGHVADVRGEMVASGLGVIETIRIGLGLKLRMEILGRSTGSRPNWNGNLSEGYNMGWQIRIQIEKSMFK